MPINDQDYKNNRDSDTPFDDSIRTVLRGDARRASNSNKAWTRILQRAQTEISQLPPMADRESELNGTNAFDLNLNAIPEHYTLLSRPDGVSFHAPQPNLNEQIGYYRRLMDMKMWRSVGSIGLLSGTV